MYPNSIYFGLKVVPIQVLWGQSIYYLGTWTLRVIIALIVALIEPFEGTLNSKPLNPKPIPQTLRALIRTPSRCKSGEHVPSCLATETSPRSTGRCF